MYTKALTLKPKYLGIVTGISKGLTMKEIAGEMGLSISAVQSKLEIIRLQLDAKNSAHAAVIAISEGLIPGLDLIPKKTNPEKCYIAGKITGLAQKDYRRFFNKGKEEVSAFGMIPVSPIDFRHAHGGTWAEFLREDISEMLKCTCVYALKNWRNSRGATLEINTALAVGLNIIHQK